jgi:hypothetical protein
LDFNSIENHFKQQQQLFGNLADTESFTLIFSLIDKARRLETENDKLAALNRHYFFKFYDGSIEKMAADFKYLMGE